MQVCEVREALLVDIIGDMGCINWYVAGRMFTNATQIENIIHLAQDCSKGTLDKKEWEKYIYKIILDEINRTNLFKLPKISISSTAHARFCVSLDKILKTNLSNTNFSDRRNDCI